ncbi:MAG: Type 1 glutamine amidotransferase-like domain-containing protein [Candidatus Dormibacteria bacterium]
MVVLATASAPEGEVVFGRWNSQGLAHYARLGRDAIALPVRVREDATRPEHAELVRRASMVFCSGGNPGYLHQTLAETPLLEAIRDLLRRGGVYGGCSAGAMVAGAAITAGQRGRLLASPSLGLLPGEVLGVHWDAALMRPWRRAMAARAPAGCRFLGIGERTAISGGRAGWMVFGRGGVEVRHGGRNHVYRAGEMIPALPDRDWTRS